MEAMAQAFVFAVAGLQTTSSLISHWLYELALNPDVQAKVHEEIDELLESRDSFTYENLMQLRYLDMTLQEALRKHPSGAFLIRVCRKDYKIPNSDFTIPKGMRIIISISGIHSNPDIYPDPERFDPMRFTKENIASRHHFSHISFGEGPRFCIGQRLENAHSKLLFANVHYAAPILRKPRARWHLSESREKRFSYSKDIDKMRFFDFI